jgi:hypothetical protein
MEGLRLGNQVAHLAPRGRLAGVASIEEVHHVNAENTPDLEQPAGADAVCVRAEYGSWASSACWLGRTFSPGGIDSHDETLRVQG